MADQILPVHAPIPRARLPSVSNTRPRPLPLGHPGSAGALQPTATDPIELKEFAYLQRRDQPVILDLDPVVPAIDPPTTTTQRASRAKMPFSFGGSSSSAGSSTAFIVNAVLRFVQFVFAIAVIGLYGTDISNARKGHEHQDSRWIYAMVVAALSAITCLVFVIPKLKSYIAFAWDLVLFILWTAVFGVFASIYIHQNPHGDHNISRLKNAVWIDLINMLLWFVTAIFGALMFWRNRNSRSQFTGRAAV